MSDRPWRKYPDEAPWYKGPFLVFRPGGGGYSSHMGISYFYADEDGFTDGEYHGNFAVTHWMELPEKP